MELILQIGAAVGAILRIGAILPLLLAGLVVFFALRQAGISLVPWCGIFRFWLVGWVGHSYSALAAYDLKTWKRLFFTKLCGPGKLFALLSYYLFPSPESPKLLLLMPRVKLFFHQTLFILLKSMLVFLFLRVIGDILQRVSSNCDN